MTRLASATSPSYMDGKCPSLRVQLPPTRRRIPFSVLCSCANAVKVMSSELASLGLKGDSRVSSPHYDSWQSADPGIQREEL